MMAKAEMVVEVRIRDMRVVASPYSERLERLLDRVTLDDSDDRA